MLIEINGDNSRELYDYFNELIGIIPFYLPVGFEIWKQSMFDDRENDGDRLFKDIRTYMLKNDGKVDGFIQFGLTAFEFYD